MLRRSDIFRSVIKSTVFVLSMGAVVGLALGKITGEQYLGILTAFMTGYFSGRVPSSKPDPTSKDFT